MVGKIFIDTSFYSTQKCRSFKEMVFVFGDNIEEWGFGGQAIIRDEPNAFGVPTKISPYEYMRDDHEDIHKFTARIFSCVTNLKSMQEEGKTIVFPQGGLGTGLAQLPEKAPGVFKFLNELLEEQFGINHVIDEETEEWILVMKGER